MEFTEGIMVEVSSDDEGFRGAWYLATVLKSMGTNFFVEYEKLKAEDEMGLLRETVDQFHIRPYPPGGENPKPFRLLEEVDANYNDGWWVGIVSKVMPNGSYMVYFKAWNEESEFKHGELRPHFDWVDGKWIRPSLSWEL